MARPACVCLWLSVRTRGWLSGAASPWSVFMGASHRLGTAQQAENVPEGGLLQTRPAIQGAAGGGGFCPRGAVAKQFRSLSRPRAATLLVLGSVLAAAGRTPATSVTNTLGIPGEDTT